MSPLFDGQSGELYHLSVFNPAFTTAEGVGAGSTLAQIQAAYGSQLKMLRPYTILAAPDPSGPPSPVIVDGDRFMMFWFNGGTKAERIVVSTLYENNGEKIPIVDRVC